MASIRVESLSKEFPGGRKALDAVSLNVEDHEVVTVVGPSGCGKSTLLRLIAGLDSPTSGEILIDARPVQSVPPRDRNIAMVFQSYALYPHMTCYENLALNLHLKKVSSSEIDRRVHETARLLDIEDLLSKRPRQLSGGERQRVAVARALIRDPQAFLLDEPLSNLDALLRERVRHELKLLFQRLNSTVLYVTHDQTEAMSLANRVVVLDRGKVQQIGPPDEIYKAPKNVFVASFVGSPSMNVFDTVMERGAFKLGPSTIRSGIDFTGNVSIGIRPEAIRLGGDIPGTVRWHENLGGQCLIGLVVGEIPITVLAQALPESNSINISFSPGDVHVFEKSSGANLARRSADRAPDA